MNRKVFEDERTFRKSNIKKITFLYEMNLLFGVSIIIFSKFLFDFVASSDGVKCGVEKVSSKLGRTRPKFLF